MAGAINVILPFLTLFIGAFGVYLIGRLFKCSNRLSSVLTASVLVISLVQLILLMIKSEIDLLSYGVAGGIVFQPEMIGIFISAATLVIAILITIYSGESFLQESSFLLYYALILLSLSGIIGMFFTTDLFNLFLLSELSNLTASALIAMQSKVEGSIKAGFKYLIMSSLGTMIMLLGVYFVYKGTGSIDLSVISGVVNNSTRIGSGCFLVGFSIKAGVVPLHAWVPEVYSNAPCAISGLLAGVLSKSILFIMSITCLKLGLEPSELGLYLIVFGWLNMILGSIRALPQRNIRRFLSYSSIAQTGYLMFALGIGHYYQVESAFTASIFLFLVIATAKSLAFLNTGIYEHSLGTSDSLLLSGVHKSLKFAPFSLSLALAGLAGIPPLAGFIGKWLVFSSVISAGGILSLVGLVIFLFCTVVGLGGYLPMIVRQFNIRNEQEDKEQTLKRPSLWMSIPVGVLSALYLIIGFHPTPWLELINGVVSLLR